MTDTTDRAIPEDVRFAAADIGEEVRRFPGATDWIIARAILAERERYAATELPTRRDVIADIELMILYASGVEHKPAWVPELARDIATALRPIHGREAVDAIRQLSGSAEYDGPEAGFWVGHVADIIAEAFGVTEHD